MLIEKGKVRACKQTRASEKFVIWAKFNERLKYDVWSGTLL